MATAQYTKDAIKRYQKKGKAVIITESLRIQLGRWKELGYASKFEFCDALAQEISVQ